MAPKEHPNLNPANQNGIALYTRIDEDDTFETAARELFTLVRDTQKRYPGRRRILYFDIVGHRDAAGKLDPDMEELRTHFVIAFLMPYLSEAPIPGVGHLVNRKAQEDKIPDELTITSQRK